MMSGQGIQPSIEQTLLVSYCSFMTMGVALLLLVIVLFYFAKKRCIMLFAHIAMNKLKLHNVTPI